jgi:hypothetical protein
MATAPKTPTSDRKAPTLVSSDPKRTVPVTTDTFIRTDSDLYFGNIVKDGGSSTTPGTIPSRRKKLERATSARRSGS